MADDGVSAVEETGQESTEESSEGVKTVKLLFKLGAECLERYVALLTSGKN